MKDLRRGWTWFAALSLAFLIVGYLLLRYWWAPAFATRWLFLPLITLTYLLGVLKRNLSTNHRPGEDYLLPALGWGNRLTLLRGLLIAAILGFLFLPRPAGWLAWIPGILYILSDAADFLDGYLARITNHATRLGEILDMSFDGVGVMAASLLAVQYGQAPVWFILVGCARLIFLGGIWLRVKLNKPVYQLAPDISRRVFAGLMMGFLAVALLPLFSPPGLHIAAALFGLPFLVGFIWDWLIVIGAVQPAEQERSYLGIAIRHWLPALLRLGILGLSLGLLLPWFRNQSTMGAGVIQLHISLTLVLALLVLGVLPRAAAVLGLIILGMYQVYTPLDGFHIALAVAYTLILYLGSGAFSLWTPEERLVFQRAGEKSPSKSQSGALHIETSV